MRVRSLVLLATLLTPLPAVADHVEGNGNLVDNVRNVGDFHGVQASGGIEVKLAVGPRAVSVRADENLQPYLVTDVTDGVLGIGWKNGTSVENHSHIVVSVTAPKLDRLNLSGGSMAAGALVSGESLAVGESGGSRVELTGKLAVKKLVVGLSGGSQLVTDVAAASLELDASGGSQAHLGGTADAATMRMSGGSMVEAAALQIGALELAGSGASSISVAAASAHGALSGASHLEVPQSAKVNVATSGASGVSRH
jgi:hypothetical protein